MRKSRLQKTTEETVVILDSLQVPFFNFKEGRPLTPAGINRMALCVMALGEVKRSWRETSRKSLNAFRSRDIIDFLNANYGLTISKGSYDDIRRVSLAPVLASGIVLRSKPEADYNDPTNGYILDPDFVDLVQSFGELSWHRKLKIYSEGRASIREELDRKRSLAKVQIELPDNLKFLLGPGAHNELQANIVREFLPRFLKGSKILYFGDAAARQLHKDDETLQQIGFFDLDKGDLPDIVTYDPIRNWVTLIEAVHSGGPMHEGRVLELKRSLVSCTADPIFVTAFADAVTFKKWSASIAWETEVWIAERPDHMIHYNGDKFLGPY